MTDDQERQHKNELCDLLMKEGIDGRKAALDMRLVDPLAEIHGDTKVSRAIENIYRTWEEGRDRRSTQLVFCDLSTPNPDRFNVYDDIRDKLIAKGIPAKEIAYTREGRTEAGQFLKKLEMLKKRRSQRTR